MTIQGSRNNPFQLPQFSQRPVQPQGNPFRGGHHGAHAPGGQQPPADGLGLFKSQINNKSITPDLNRPRPPQGAGGRLFAMG